MRPGSTANGWSSTATARWTGSSASSTSALRPRCSGTKRRSQLPVRPCVHLRGGPRACAAHAVMRRPGGQAAGRGRAQLPRVGLPPVHCQVGGQARGRGGGIHCRAHRPELQQLLGLACAHGAAAAAARIQPNSHAAAAAGRGHRACLWCACMHGSACPVPHAAAALGIGCASLWTVDCFPVDCANACARGHALRWLPCSLAGIQPPQLAKSDGRSACCRRQRGEHGADLGAAGGVRAGAAGLLHRPPGPERLDVPPLAAGRLARALCRRVRHRPRGRGAAGARSPCGWAWAHPPRPRRATRWQSSAAYPARLMCSPGAAACAFGAVLPRTAAR